MKSEKRERGATAFWLILKRSVQRLKKNDPLHLAGATAFFTTFALAPIFVVIIQLLGSIIGKGEIKQKIIEKFAESAPSQSIQQLNRIMDGLQRMTGAWYMDVALFLFLLFSASTLFKIIRSSIYRLWRIKRVHEKSAGFRIKHRLFSVALIISAGILLVAGLLGESIQSYLGEAIAEISISASRYFQSVYKHVISFVVAWAWFAVVFRYLTDVRPKWKTVLVGALFTAVLFNLGKFILQSLLTKSNLSSVFGASASLVILQLFVFYISILIYYGAAFTMEWSRHYQQTMHFPDYISYYTIEEKNSKEDLEHSG
jgi:membrane protein